MLLRIWQPFLLPGVMIGCETLLDGFVASMAISPESIYEFKQKYTIINILLQQIRVNRRHANDSSKAP